LYIYCVVVDLDSSLCKWILKLIIKTDFVVVSRNNCHNVNVTTTTFPLTRFSNIDFVLMFAAKKRKRKSK